MLKKWGWPGDKANNIQLLQVTRKISKGGAVDKHQSIFEQSNVIGLFKSGTVPLDHSLVTIYPAFASPTPAISVELVV